MGRCNCAGKHRFTPFKYQFHCKFDVSTRINWRNWTYILYFQTRVRHGQQQDFFIKLGFFFFNLPRSCQNAHCPQKRCTCTEISGVRHIVNWAWTIMFSFMFGAIDLNQKKSVISSNYKTIRNVMPGDRSNTEWLTLSSTW